MNEWVLFFTINDIASELVMLHKDMSTHLHLASALF
jgi:hypothetical protein